MKWGVVLCKFFGHDPQYQSPDLYVCKRCKAIVEPGIGSYGEEWPDEELTDDSEIPIKKRQ